MKLLAFIKFRDCNFLSFFLSVMWWWDDVLVIIKKEEEITFLIITVRYVIPDQTHCTF